MSDQNTNFDGLVARVRDAAAKHEAAKKSESAALKALADAERENRQAIEEFKQSRSDALQVPHRTHSLAVREVHRAKAALDLANSDLQTFAATGKVPPEPAGE